MELPEKKAHKTLWQQVADEIVSGIRSGRHPVGSQLPTEEQLRGIYRCSRHTVRSALAWLAAEGLIERHPRTGTTVINNGTTLKLAAFFETADRMLPEVKNPVFKMLSTSVTSADAALARRIQVRPGEGLARIDYVILTIGEQWLPVAYLCYYTRISNSDVLDVCRLHPDVPLERLMPQVLSRPYYRVEGSYRIRETDEETARWVSQDPGTPALEVTRRFTDSSNRFLMACVSRHAASLDFSLAITSGNY